MLSNILQLKHPYGRRRAGATRQDHRHRGVGYGKLTDVIKSWLRPRGHSRLPVFGDDMDDIEGLVHIKDLLAAKGASSSEGIDAILRTPIFVAPSMPVLDMLLDMRTKRVIWPSSSMSTAGSTGCPIEI